ncbi:MAG: PQQ-binding-like beta-propeller repeat protein [Planctomycetales bacterium]
MTGPDAQWLKAGEGKRPQSAWSFSTDAPLVALRLARETGETLAADEAGNLYSLDRRGEVRHATRIPPPIRGLAWSDVGEGGLALCGDRRLLWFDRSLTPLGYIEESERILAIAGESHGLYAAVSLESSRVALYDSDRGLVRRFQTMQPLTTIEFLAHEPALVALGDYGLLCCHTFAGPAQWRQALYVHVSDLAVTGDGQTILLACFSHGIQCYDGQGTQLGSYQLGGTVTHVATSFIPGRIAAATQEGQLYALEATGQVLWRAPLPEELRRLVCDPLGNGLLCGFQSGRIEKLAWIVEEE